MEAFCADQTIRAFRASGKMKITDVDIQWRVGCLFWVLPRQHPPGTDGTHRGSVFYKANGVGGNARTVSRKSETLLGSGFNADLLG